MTFGAVTGLFIGYGIGGDNPPESQRDSINQPRVGPSRTGEELPWETSKMNFNSERVESIPA
jgi:hypothetical protein